VLTIERHISTPVGDSEQKVVFRRTEPKDASSG
jgi:hypothetical protein